MIKSRVSKDNIVDFMSEYYVTIMCDVGQDILNKVNSVFWPRDSIGDTSIIILKIQGRYFNYDA